MNHMPKFQLTLKGRGLLRVSNFDFDDVQITSDDDDDNILNKTIEADSSNSACEKVEEWAKWFSQALLLLTGKVLTFELKNYRQLDENIVGIIASISAIPSVTVHHNLKKEEVDMAIKLVPKLATLPSDHVFRRVLSWYGKGIRDSDIIDRFISHWIALEALSNLYTGYVEPYKCKCGNVLNRRPHGAILRAFLESHGLKDNIRDIMKISGVRGELLHKGQRLKDAVSYQHKLQDILTQSILKTLFIS